MFQPRTLITILSFITLFLGLIPKTLLAMNFASIHQIYFFGDSLSDSGFNNMVTIPMLPINKAPTFTTKDGYTWAQYLAHDVKNIPLPKGPYTPDIADKITNNMTATYPSSVPEVVPTLTGINYACGGSRVYANPGFGAIPWAPSVHQQIQQFLTTTSIDPHDVFFIWAGANDLLTELAKVPAPSLEELVLTVDSVTSQLVEEVRRLAQNGAQRVVVMSLPNLGSSPFVLKREASMPNLPIELKNLSFTFDSLLNQKLGALIQQTGVHIVYIDTYSLLDNVIAHAKSGLPYEVGGLSFYFTDWSNPVCVPTPPFPDSALFCQQDSDKHIFADDLHPTDAVHHILALELENTLQMW